MREADIRHMEHFDSVDPNRAVWSGPCAYIDHSCLFIRKRPPGSALRFWRTQGPISELPRTDGSFKAPQSLRGCVYIGGLPESIKDTSVRIRAEREFHVRVSSQ